MVFYASELMHSNFEFWNFRALRQYLHFVLALEQQATPRFEVFERLILPYVRTIKKQVKKATILEELSLKVIDKVHSPSVEADLKVEVNGLLQRAIQDILKSD